ncbi:winged helix-turn-helix transcriptional regulator [Streptomyces sp. NPDC101234]|uniref:winged helix-turn-helix transcriptional regulator n=1 Tax=Streptomyces sp. NPDC101234 TaxID=3366138 RepID=UPI00381567A7
MRRTSFAQWPSSIARTTDLLGDAWTPLVLSEAFCGIRRFSAFQETLGIPRNTLTDRLRRLVEEALLEKRPYQTRPVRYDYVLTEKGRDFHGVLLVMNRWGDRWLAGEAGPPMVMRHDDCGRQSHAEVVCAACGEPMTPDNTQPLTGPGYPVRPAERPDARARFAD